MSYNTRYKWTRTSKGLIQRHRLHLQLSGTTRSKREPRQWRERGSEPSSGVIHVIPEVNHAIPGVKNANGVTGGPNPLLAWTTSSMAWTTPMAWTGVRNFKWHEPRHPWRKSRHWRGPPHPKQAPENTPRSRGNYLWKVKKNLTHFPIECSLYLESLDEFEHV